MADLRLALRTLRKTPFVTVVAVVSLALGIGANSAVFSLFHQMLLKPLPVDEPERLVNLGAPGPKPGSQSCNNAGDCDDGDPDLSPAGREYLTNPDQPFRPARPPDEDPDLDDLTAITSAAVTAQADVAVTKTGPAAVVAGNQMSYFVDVVNNGPSTARTSSQATRFRPV